MGRTAYAVAFDGDRFLMVWHRRRKGWEMPGGHVEEGETSAQAAAREFLEEAVKENPFLILKIINALSSWDYQSFETEWISMMDTVCGLKKEDAKIVVTNIYNPVANLELPSTMNQVVEDIIGNMNSIIDDHADRYGYAVADLFGSEISEHVQDDGLHPDQEGQRLIADLVCAEYKTLSQE